jgi:hypothetical protein
MCVNIFVCMMCLLLFYSVNIFVKKKKNCTMHSNVSCTFERVHGAAYELTFVCSTATPHHTHTLMHTCVQTYPVSSNAEHTCHKCTQHECGRTHLCTFERTRAEPSRDLFLGHFFSLFLPFTVASYASPPPFSVSLYPNTSKLPKIQNPPPPIISPPPTVLPPALLHHPHPPPAPISHFFPQNPRNPTSSKFPHFFSFFLLF